MRVVNFAQGRGHAEGGLFALEDEEVGVVVVAVGRHSAVRCAFHDGAGYEAFRGTHSNIDSDRMGSVLGGEPATKYFIRCFGLWVDGAGKGVKGGGQRRKRRRPLIVGRGGVGAPEALCDSLRLNCLRLTGRPPRPRSGSEGAPVSLLNLASETQQGRG